MTTAEVCPRCDEDGWVCEVCAFPEDDCDCAYEVDPDEDEPPLRRCSCNPWPPRANATRPSP